MTSRNLSTVTTNVIESYGNTAKNMINAYRVGGERMVGFVDQRWVSAVHKSSARLSAEVRANALAAQKKLSGLYSKSLSVTTDSADAVVGKVVELAEKGVTQVAANASRFEKATGMTALNTLATAAVPAAEAVSKVATSIEKQSSLLARRVAGQPVKAKAATATAKPTAKAKPARAKKAA